MSRRTRYAHAIAPHVEDELAAARRATSAGVAFHHLERAHVLSQPSTLLHVRVHWRMLRWGVRERASREVLGQLVRLVGAATKTALGWVPTGNTGGSKVPAWQPLPIAPDLQRLIDSARAAAG
ncbi:MAG: DUF3703 domain-containing protein [Rhizobacter sp.]|nr:DUF3703 domain-containing protein [Rhizobacter sp.]